MGNGYSFFFLKIHFKNTQNSCSEFCMMLQLIKKKSGIPRKQTWHPVSRWLPLFSVLLRSGYPQRAPGGAVPSAERYGKMFQTPKPKQFEIVLLLIDVLSQSQGASDVLKNALFPISGAQLRVFTSGIFPGLWQESENILQQISDGSPGGRRLSSSALPTVPPWHKPPSSDLRPDLGT